MKNGHINKSSKKICFPHNFLVLKHVFNVFGYTGVISKKSNNKQKKNRFRGLVVMTSLELRERQSNPIEVEIYWKLFYVF